MNFSIYIDDSLYNELKESAENMNITRNSIIKSALVDWLERHRQSRWRKTIMECRVGDDFPDVEELRKELLPPREIEL